MRQHTEWCVVFLRADDVTSATNMLKLLCPIGRRFHQQMDREGIYYRWNVCPSPSRGWGRRGKLRDVWGPAVGQKYKVCQNVPFWKKNFKMFSREKPCENVWGAPRECFPGLRCGSRWACVCLLAVLYTRLAPAYLLSIGSARTLTEYLTSLPRLLAGSEWTRWFLTKKPFSDSAFGVEFRPFGPQAAAQDKFLAAPQ